MDEFCRVYDSQSGQVCSISSGFALWVLRNYCFWQGLRTGFFAIFCRNGLPVVKLACADTAYASAMWAGVTRLRHEQVAQDCQKLSEIHIVSPVISAFSTPVQQLRERMQKTTPGFIHAMPRRPFWFATHQPTNCQQKISQIENSWRLAKYILQKRY